MFENLRNAVNAHYDNEEKKFAASLDGLTASAALASWYYRDKMTPAALQIVQGLDGSALLPAAVKAKMLRRFVRENEKARGEKLDKLDRVAGYTLPVRVSVGVEWHKSRTWGYNPAATVRAERVRTEGAASGCGYDKESAAIASAMNVNPEILRILYAHAEQGKAFPYSVHTFAGLPSFDGGCGVSCFNNVFQACGYTFRGVASGKLFNAYTLDRIIGAEV